MENSRAEVKKARLERKMKKTAKHRGLKNFLFWLLGFAFIPAIIAVLVFAIPVKTYLKLGGVKDINQIVNEEKLGSNSIFGFIKSLSSGGDFTFGDINFIAESIGDVLGDQFVKVDVEGLRSVKVKFDKDFTNNILKNIYLSPNLFKGEIGNLEIFKTVKTGEPDVTKPSFDYRLYAYCVSGSVEEGTAVLADAFNADGTRVEASMGKQLYLRSVCDFNVSSVSQLFAKRFKLSSADSLVKTLSGMSEEEYEKSVLIGVIKGKTVEQLGELNENDIKLSVVFKIEGNEETYDILLDSIKGGKIAELDRQLEAHEITLAEYNILKSAVEAMVKADLSLADLTKMDINTMHLSKVLKTPDVEHPDRNKKLYDIIREATGKATNDEISIKDLSDNFDVGKVRLASVIDKTSTDAQSNKILKALLEDDNITVENIGGAINEMSVEEVYDVHCFVKDSAKTRDASAIFYKRVDASGKDVYELKTYVEGKTGYTTDYHNAFWNGYEIENDFSKPVQYYLSNTSSVWLFLLYTASEIDGWEELPIDPHDYSSKTGIACVYTSTELKVKDIDAILDTVAPKVMSSTVYQLYMAGILEGETASINSLTITQVVSKLNDLV